MRNDTLVIHEVTSAGGKIVGVFRQEAAAVIFAEIERRARAEEVHRRKVTGEILTEGELKGELSYASVGIQVRTRTITFDDHLVENKENTRFVL
jgi:hypothetical protein